MVVRKGDKISIHAPTRGATYCVKRAITLGKFQSTLPRGERPTVSIPLFTQLGFQSTLPRGERRVLTQTHPHRQHFNPRSHEGSDIRKPYLIIKRVISIHAPTRGATFFPCKFVYYSSNFNPRSHEGSDVYNLVSRTGIDISIHAPTRGATRMSSKLSSSTLFQSTLPRGERQQFSPKSSLFSQQKLSKIFNLNNKLF